MWGAGPSAIETITKGEFNTDPDTINTGKFIQLFKDYNMPNEISTTAEEISSGQNKGKTKHRRTLAKISIPRKKLRIQKH